jgi:polar amino acid transport system substrate-binding protein
MLRFSHVSRRLRVLICLVVLSAGTAQAENTLCTKPIRVALFEFGVLYRSDTNDGVDARLLQEMERRSGCKFERVFMPRARIWNELQAGSLDMATAAIPTPERKAYAYLFPYMQTRNVVLLRKQSASIAANQDAFEKSSLRMATVRGFRHEPAYDAMIAKLAEQGRVVEAADVTDLLRMLDKGVVDAVLSQPIVFRQYLDEKTMQAKLVQRDWAPQDQSSVGAMILARKSFTDDQARHWDQLVANLLRDGSFQKIARSFLPPEAAKALTYTGPRSPD